jgi:hypothetical protein
METTTPFDLNQAIQCWRENLGHSPAFRSENLYELETHLRDSIAILQHQGLSPEESFLVAMNRTGKDAALESEFAKINLRTVWLDRVLWMLIGFQVWSFISGLISSITRAAVFYGLAGTGHDFATHGRAIPVTLFVLAHLAGFVGSLACCWWLIRRRSNSVVPWMTKLLSRYGTLTLAFVVVCLCNWSNFLLSNLWTPFILRQSNDFMKATIFSSALFSVAIQILALVGLTFFIARKRLRMSRA